MWINLKQAKLTLSLVSALRAWCMSACFIKFLWLEGARTKWHTRGKDNNPMHHMEWVLSSFGWTVWSSPWTPISRPKFQVQFVIWMFVIFIQFHIWICSIFVKFWKEKLMWTLTSATRPWMSVIVVHRPFFEFGLSMQKDDQRDSFYDKDLEQNLEYTYNVSEN